MVGGTKLPPQDSESGPWSHEHKAKTTPKATPKPKPSTKGKRKTLWSVEVSLDNADTVIDGGTDVLDAERPGQLYAAGSHARHRVGHPGEGVTHRWADWAPCLPGKKSGSLNNESWSEVSDWIDGWWNQTSTAGF